MWYVRESKSESTILFAVKVLWVKRFIFIKPITLNMDEEFASLECGGTFLYSQSIFDTVEGLTFYVQKPLR